MLHFRKLTFLSGALGAFFLLSPLATAQVTQGQKVAPPTNQASAGEKDRNLSTEGGGENEIEWTTITRTFSSEFWGEQEKTNARISLEGDDMRQVAIGLQDGDTSVAGPSDWDRERAEMFLFYRVLDEWFAEYKYVRLTYQLQLGSDFDVDDKQRGSRRIFQIKSSKESGKPIFDIIIEDGLMKIRYNETPKGRGKPIILAEGPAPDVSKMEWIPIKLEMKMSEGEDGYLRMRAGKLTTEYFGPTQHDENFNNFKLGEYRNRKYSSGNEPHRLRNPWLRVGKEPIK